MTFFFLLVSTDAVEAEARALFLFFFFFSFLAAAAAAAAAAELRPPKGEKSYASPIPKRQVKTLLASE